MSSDLKKIIGARIQSARIDAGLTQAQLAEKVGRTEESISNMERGVTTTSIEKLFDIGNVTERPLEYFVSGIDKKVNDPARQKQLDRIAGVCETLDTRRLKIAAAQIEALKG